MNIETLDLMAKIVAIVEEKLKIKLTSIDYDEYNGKLEITVGFEGKGVK